MKRYKFFRVVPFLAFALLTSACDDGLTDLTELNDNPNGPLDVSPALVLTSGQQGAASDLLGFALNFNYADVIAQHLAEIQYAEEDIYDYRSTSVNADFRGAYSGYLMDFQRVIDLGREAGNGNVEAGGLIMKSWAFHNLTDIWGDLPYSEAFKGDAEERVITPVYDTQQAIYNQLFADLTTAVGLIDTGSNPFGSQDLIYGGDMAAWQKFANSLRLRLAIHLAEVDATTGASQFNAALSAPGGVFTSAADNAEFCYGSVDKNPWFTSFVQSRPNDRRVSATMIDTLKSFNDPRLSAYAQPITADSAIVDGEHIAVTAPFYAGMPNGYEEHPYATDETSFVGEQLLAPDACLPILTYDEVLFLRAEAAARGWTAGDAAALYNAAITASMERWGVDAAEIVAYLAQPRVQFDPANWQEQIGLQKWIALFGQGIEAFTEVRRLGFPVLTPGPDAQIDELPDRYPYPFSEQTYNEANLAEANARQGTDGGQVGPVWWDTNDSM